MVKKTELPANIVLCYSIAKGGWVIYQKPRFNWLAFTRLTGYHPTPSAAIKQAGIS